MLLAKSGGSSQSFGGSTLLDGAPVTLAVSQNNWNPNQLADASQLLVNALSALSITGIAGAVLNRLLFLTIAPGSAGVTLVSGSGASDAANRIYISGGNLVLAAGNTAILIASARGWELVSSSVVLPGTAGFGIGSSTVTSVAAAPATGAFINYAPAGWSAATCNQLRLTPTGGDVTLRGLDATGAADNWSLFLTNEDVANSIILTDQDGASAAGNRFVGWNSDSVTINPGQMVVLAYIGGRWRIR